MKGPPISPALDPNKVIVRFMYDGGVLAHARICLIDPKTKSDGDDNVVTGSELLTLLETEGGVDFERFYASVYETEASGGGWMPINRNSASVDSDGDIQLPVPPLADNESEGEESAPISRRIDVKLFQGRWKGDRNEYTTVKWPIQLLSQRESYPNPRVTSVLE